VLGLTAACEGLDDQRRGRGGIEPIRVEIVRLQKGEQVVEREVRPVQERLYLADLAAGLPRRVAGTVAEARRQRGGLARRRCGR
jgi:hypothetical protein